jgi:hypothetical protein
MPAKIVLSLIRTGVPAVIAQTIAQDIERTARDGITTGEIRIKALRMTMARNPDWMKTSIVPGAQLGKNRMSYSM